MIKIGDKVKVVRKVKKENGWDNSWVQDMDKFVGKSGVVESIEDWGVNINFTHNAHVVDFSFPVGSLELIKDKQCDDECNCSVSKTGSEFSIDRGIKYQYLPYGNLCLTIATHIKKNAFGDAIVDWSVAFKSPKDRFSKQIAREVISTRETRRLFVQSGYSRDLIVTKILADLVYNEENLSLDYKNMVLRLLSNYSYEVVMNG